MRILHEDDENEDFEYDMDEDLDLDDDEERDDDIEDDKREASWSPAAGLGATPTSTPVDVDLDGIEDDWRSGLLPQCPLTFEEVVIQALEEYLRDSKLFVPQRKLRYGLKSFYNLPELQMWSAFNTPVLAPPSLMKPGERPLGYTTVLGKLQEFRRKLIEHRKDKKRWNGQADAYRDEERALVAIVRAYKELLQDPYYVNKIRKARNRARRKYRKPLRHIPTLVSRADSPHWWVRAQGSYTDDIAAHLPWMITRVKKKRFKTKQQLAYCYRKPIAWVQGALDQALKKNLITEEELKACFRGPGRPKKGVPRGSYRKRGTKRRQDISPNLLQNLEKSVRPSIGKKPWIYFPVPTTPYKSRPPI